MSTQPLAHALKDEKTWSFLLDAIVLGGVIGVVYLMMVVGRYWFGAIVPAAEISNSPWAIPMYTVFSLVRMTAAYLLSLVFAVAYGYVAAYNKRLQAAMLATLDILQSIPVLSFLPGVMLAMVSLFPTRQVGVEIGSVILIFTGQVWNMAFSFYASLKAIPKELREASRIYRFNRLQQFLQLELPYGTIGLVWNSMVSVAGGWFFLMACEMFVLGKRDFRLPGLGSYLQSAASEGGHARHHLGTVRNDRRDCVDRPDRLASGHRVGRQVQNGAGGKRGKRRISDPALSPTLAAAHPAYEQDADSLERTSSTFTPRDTTTNTPSICVRRAGAGFCAGPLRDSCSV